jgi:hypothetical protein
MKLRLDHVTNSSSSSFVCDICGRAESGWDMCLTEVDMIECENGHTICEHERLKTISDIDIARRLIKNNMDF